MTMRDQIWNVALERLVSRGKFKASDILNELELTESQRQTVRRCLRELEEHGWLHRESEQSSIWRLGNKGKLLLNVSESTIEESEE